MRGTLGGRYGLGSKTTRFQNVRTVRVTYAYAEQLHHIGYAVLLCRMTSGISIFQFFQLSETVILDMRKTISDI